MYSNSSWGNCVVVLQAFSSLFYIAWLTGIVFAKFARPHARVLFSDHALIETRDGKRTLTFRVANERGNDIVEASIRVSILKTEITTEGKRMRRFFDLDLARSSSPLFILTWQVFHVIDERSPLYGMSCDDLMADDGLRGRPSCSRSSRRCERNGPWARDGGEVSARRGACRPAAGELGVQLHGLRVRPLGARGPRRGH